MLPSSASATRMHSYDMSPEYEALGQSLPGGQVNSFDTTQPELGAFIEGSMVPISKHWAMTSAHVVDEVLDVLIFANFGSGMPRDTSQDYTATEVFMHPDYDVNSSVFGSPDLALLYFEQGFRDDVPLATIYDGVVQLDDVLTLAGYGVPGISGDTGVFDGIKRGFNAPVTSFRNNGMYLETSFQPEGFFPGIELNGASTGGDSGSGVFIQTALGPQLLAIHSYGRGDGYGSNSGAYLLGQDTWYLDTIASVSTPEPSSLILLVLGILTVIGRRRRY